ncbi:hypothetical protein SRIMM317S_04879 [Streptomyces rimosus subsp. rimosus]
MGAASERSSGSRFATAASSTARSSSIHSLRRAAPVSSRPDAACAAAASTSPASPTIQVDIPVPADRAVVQIDLHHGRGRRKPLPVPHPEVERRPDDHDQIGVREGVPAGQLEVVRITGRQRAAAAPFM